MGFVYIFCSKFCFILSIKAHLINILHDHGVSLHPTAKVANKINSVTLFLERTKRWPSNERRIVPSKILRTVVCNIFYVLPVDKMGVSKARRL